MVQGGIGPVGKAFVILMIFSVIFGLFAGYWYWIFRGRKK